MNSKLDLCVLTRFYVLVDAIRLQTWVDLVEPTSSHQLSGL